MAPDARIDCSGVRDVEAPRVAPDLALVDVALVRLVDVLYRILDRDDVSLAAVVDDVDHRSKRRRLAAPSRTGHDEESVALAAGSIGNITASLAVVSVTVVLASVWPCQETAITPKTFQRNP